jgi:hypothetical protein
MGGVVSGLGDAVVGNHVLRDPGFDRVILIGIAL